MSIISGIVPTQYIDIVTGINALIASGVASGTIDEFYLYVDDSYYTGVFDAVVPNSGSFYIIGSGTYFAPQDTCNVYTEGDGTFNINTISIIGEDTSNWLFNISGSSSLIFKDSSIVSPLNGVTTESGTLIMIDSYTGGSGAGTFFSGNAIDINNTSISNFALGVYSSDSSIKKSNIIECTTGIQIPLSGSTYIEDTLIHDGTYGILKTIGATVNINQSTIEAVYPIYGSGGILIVESTIMDSVTRCINGFLASGSYIENAGLYPSGWLVADVINAPSGVNISNAAAVFNNATIGDYRLKFDYSNGSPYVEHIPSNVPSDVTLRTEISNITFSDDTGTISDLNAQNFIYKQSNSLLFSDYNKEIEFAYFMNSHKNIEYFANTQATFSIYEQNLQSCFSQTGAHPEPFDWDLKTIESVEIVEDPTDLQYVIPRSFINLEPIVDNKIGLIGEEFRFDKMTKANVTVYNKEDARGLAYDYDLSSPGEPMAWRIDGRNQLLVKLNLFTSEEIQVYPILSPNLSDNNVTLIKGLIYVGPRDNKYRFIDILNPQKEYIGETEAGHFKWIDTTINTQFDARGILTYKNNLYITGTKYSEDIYDRTAIPQLSGEGTLLRYYNDNTYTHYLTALDSLGSRKIPLNINNTLPTDITVYEDGSLLVVDYSNYSELFRYRFAYDYAILDEQYDKLSRVILREYYPSVNF